MHRFFVLALLLPLLLACLGDNDHAALPGDVSPTVPATRAPGSVPSPARVDGTVAPSAFGGTDPVTIKSNPDPPIAQAIVRDVRMGAHPEEGGWDRIVFEFEAILPAADIRYESSAFACGSGARVPVAAAAVLIVRMTPAIAHNDEGRPTARTLQPVSPRNAILETHSICDFESHVDWAIGVKGRQPFRVTRLENPIRLVIDVKW